MLKKALALLLTVTTLLPLAACTVSKSEPVPETEKGVSTNLETPFYQTEKIHGNPSEIGASSAAGETLPNVFINVADKKEIVSKDYYLKATVTVDGCAQSFVINDVNAEVRKRGNGTIYQEKGSIHVKFEEKYNLFGQASGYGRSWVLVANSFDASLLRSHAVYTMAHTLENISWATSSSFVHLYVNGNYRGVYQLVENHNDSDGRIEINEDPNVVDTDYIIELDAYVENDTDKKQGVDWFGCGSFKYSDTTGKGVKINKYAIRSDYNSKARCEFLENYFKAADDAIMIGDFEEVSKYIDLASFVDMYILQELSCNPDVGWSSFYMVKKAGDKIYFTCPWDFDLSFGNHPTTNNGSYKNLFAGNGKSVEHKSNSWYFNLFKRKWFVDMVAKRWNEVAMGMRDTALDEINRIYGDFRSEFLKNYTVWDVPTKSYSADFNPTMTQDTFDEHVAFLKLYLCSRYDWLDNYFNSNQKYEQLAKGEM